jgi:hypothetical protein
VFKPEPQLLLSPAKAPLPQHEHPVRGEEPAKVRRIRRKVSHCTSKYRGVSWHKRDFRWVARAWVRGQTHNLGTFGSERLAAITVDSCLIKCYGDEATALLNFPDAAERERITAEEFQVDSGDEALKSHHSSEMRTRRKPRDREGRKSSLSSDTTEQFSTSEGGDDDDNDDDDDDDSSPVTKKRLIEIDNNADE